MGWKMATLLMTIFIHGNKGEIILLRSLVLFFFVFLLLVTALELAHKEYMRARKEFEHALSLYEDFQSEYEMVRK